MLERECIYKVKERELRHVVGVGSASQKGKPTKEVVCWFNVESDLTFFSTLWMIGPITSKF